MGTLKGAIGYWSCHTALLPPSLYMVRHKCHLDRQIVEQCDRERVIDMK